MTIIEIIFYLFSALMLLSGLMVIMTRNAVRAALFLILTFFCAAVLWMLLSAEFLSVTLVLVYVGAVAVLFLFVVMMIDVEKAPLKEGFASYLPLGILIAALIIGSITYILLHEQQGFVSTVVPEVYGADYSNIQVLGKQLYTTYFYPFEIAAVILLVAIIAAISLTYRGARQRKTQSIEKQVRTRAKDRIRLVKMEAEK